VIQITGCRGAMLRAVATPWGSWVDVRRDGRATVAGAVLFVVVNNIEPNRRYASALKLLVIFVSVKRYSTLL
jgi:hypothetical protein